MTLPRSRGELAPVAAIASSTRAAELGLAQRRGQVLGEDRDLGLFLGREVVAAAGAERLDRLAAGLDLAASGRPGTRRRSGAALPLLDVVGGAGRPSAGRHDAARRRPAWRWRCRSGAILKGHRFWHLGRGGPPRTRWAAGGPAGIRLDVRPGWARSADLRSGVLLALGFLALALHRRLLVVLASASLGEDAALLDLLVEATQGAFERLVLTHSDFCQSRFTSPGLGSSWLASRLAASRPRRTPDGDPVRGWRSVAEGPSRSNVRSSVRRRVLPRDAERASYDAVPTRRPRGDPARSARRRRHVQSATRPP